MDVLAQLRKVAQSLDQIGAKPDRVRRGEAESLEALDFVYRLEQLHERTLAAAGVTDPG